MNTMFSRRSLLKQFLFLPAVIQYQKIKQTLSEIHGNRFKIGACDWSIGKWSDIDAFKVASKIGVDGIMVDMGDEKNNLHIRRKEIQQAYLKESAQTGIAISSVALGIFNQVPFHSDKRTEEWISDSIEAAKKFNVKVVLLAFFNASDLRHNNSKRQSAISILRNTSTIAEKKGVTLGIESYLNADEHIDMIEKTGSPNVKAYVDFRNTSDAGYDPVKEFKKMGKERVCELHMKENGSLLDKGSVDWNAVSKAIFDMGYTGDGWMQIEGALPRNADIILSYQHNLSYLKRLFNK